jgi:ABC-type hemin transport system ATPase subunit
MHFELRYCKSFDHARITLHIDKLNIVLAPNGTGKSTIAKAISLGWRPSEWCKSTGPQPGVAGLSVRTSGDRLHG